MKVNSSTGFRHWNRPYGIAAFAFILLLIAFEWRTYFAERAIGQYLVWQNAGRAKVGRRWQVEKKQLLAGTRLERISKELRSKEKKLASIADFAGLIDLVLQEKQQILSPNQFARLYESLPFYLQPLIISPDSLLYYRLNQTMDNILLNRGEDELEILFLASQNRVLRYISLTDAQLDMIMNHGKETVVDVRSDPRFENRVYPLDVFYSALSNLSYEMRQNILQALPALLEIAGPGTEVAISNKISDELVEVAIAPDNFRAYIYYLPEDWIINFITILHEDNLIRNESQDIL